MSTGLPAKPPRLRFIDMARSVAILLMLEGHFVDDSLLLSARDPDHPVFATWTVIRSFTAPMFLTVTGLIFSYLLLRHEELAWHQNPRLRKGGRRVLELFFWGYLVQSYAFHILECIACGLAVILLLYAIQKWLRVIPLALCFLAAALALFSAWPLVAPMHKGMFWVEHAWWNISHFFHGRSRAVILFPTIPFLGFTLMGAFIGCVVRQHRDQVQRWWFPSLFAAIGALLYFGALPALTGLDALAKGSVSLGPTYWLYEKLGMVSMVLSLLIFIDHHSGHRIRQDSLFLRIGQNTLLIYVLHMMVLYGSFFGYGLNDLCHHRLNPWQAALGAALFLGLFVLLIHFLPRIEKAIGRLWHPIRDKALRTWQRARSR